MTDSVATGAFPAGVLEPEYGLDAALDPDEAQVFTDVSETDRAPWRRARAFVEADVLPIIDGYWDRADFPAHLVPRMGALDLLRDGVDVAGLPPVSPFAAGLVTMELSRGDLSVAAVAGIQGGLAMRSIAVLGSDEQRDRWLAPLAAGTETAAFALSEPAHGSDSTSLETRAVSVPGGYRISGAKKWVGNGSIGGLTVVWARGDDDRVHGYLVPQETEGYDARVIEGKIGLRAIWQTRIRLDDVFVPTAAALPGARSFRDTARVLVATRLGVAWSAVGSATASYEAAVQYAGKRMQFGRPLAASQIVQERLARMLAELTQAQLLVTRLARVDEAGGLTGEQAALAKFATTRAARSIAQNARDLLGGNGLLLQHRVGRHFADMEAAHTYEGTETIQALLIGRGITGISAFA